jgi:hypothetical protein
VGSGVVYGVIVLLWAVVLVPMWLRRHDAANETRSADRFSHAMRTLSPRNTPGQREIVMPARAPETTRPVVSGPVDMRAAARRSLARRRRRVLFALVATAAGLAVVAAFGIVPWPVVAIPVVLLVLYVVNLRMQAKRASALRRRAPSVAREGRPTRAPAPAPAPDPSLVVETKGDTRLWRSVPAGAAAPLVTEELVSQRLAQTRAATASAPEVAADEQVTEVIVVEPAGLAEPEDGTWQPAEFPLPTYVTAPKAVRPVRVIDLTSPGAWTSGRFLEDAIPEAEDAVEQAMAEADGAEGELDALLERRPAVND